MRPHERKVCETILGVAAGFKLLDFFAGGNGRFLGDRFTAAVDCLV